MRTSNGWLKSLQNLKGLSWLFTRRSRASGRSSTSPVPNSTASARPTNIFHRCTDISLESFLDCLLNRNLRRLLKYGDAQDHHLAEAWEQVYTEYCDLTGSTQYKTIRTVRNDYQNLHAKREAIRCALIVLAQRYSEKMVRLIRDYGYNYAFNWEDPASYRKDMEVMTARLKALDIPLGIKKQEYERLITGYESREVTVNDWNMMIGQVEKFMQFHINRREITVSEFAAYKRMMELQFEADKKELEKMRNKGNG